jgi:hypothetical protein
MEIRVVLAGLVTEGGARIALKHSVWNHGAMIVPSGSCCRGFAGNRGYQIPPNDNQAASARHTETPTILARTRK